MGESRDRFTATIVAGLRAILWPQIAYHARDTKLSRFLSECLTRFLILLLGIFLGAVFTQPREIDYDRHLKATADIPPGHYLYEERKNVSR